MAVVASESATETSVHEGQRTPASIAAARCDVVGVVPWRAPLPMTRATPRTARGRATFTQSGRRLARSATRRPRCAQTRRVQGRVEVLLGGRSDEHGGDAARRVYDKGRRRRGDPVVVGDDAARIADGRPQVPVL